MLWQSVQDPLKCLVSERSVVSQEEHEISENKITLYLFTHLHTNTKSSLLPCRKHHPVKAHISAAKDPAALLSPKNCSTTQKGGKESNFTSKNNQ